MWAMLSSALCFTGVSQRLTLLGNGRLCSFCWCRKGSRSVRTAVVFPQWGLKYSLVFCKAHCSEMLIKLYLERKNTVVNDRGPSGFLCLYKGISFTAPSAFINHPPPTAVWQGWFDSDVSVLSETKRLHKDPKLEGAQQQQQLPLSCSSSKHCVHTLLNDIKKHLF